MKNGLVLVDFHHDFFFFWLINTFHIISGNSCFKGPVGSSKIWCDKILHWYSCFHLCRWPCCTPYFDVNMMYCIVLYCIANQWWHTQNKKIIVHSFKAAVCLESRKRNKESKKLGTRSGAKTCPDIAQLTPYR